MRQAHGLEPFTGIGAVFQLLGAPGVAGPLGLALEDGLPGEAILGVERVGVGFHQGFGDGRGLEHLEAAARNRSDDQTLRRGDGFPELVEKMTGMNLFALE